LNWKKRQTNFKYSSIYFILKSIWTRETSQNEKVKVEKVFDEKVNDEKDFGKVNVNFTLCQSDLEKGPVEPVAAQKGEDRVWGYNFGMRDSPIAREAAFEPEFARRSKAEAEPEGHGGRWKQDERTKASKRAEKKRVKAEAKQNKNKTKISQPHLNESHSSPASHQQGKAENASITLKENRKWSRRKHPLTRRRK
jgi:hypothetical protein